MTKVKPALKYLQQRSSGSDFALFHPHLGLVFFKHIGGCALLMLFMSDYNTKHLNLSPYGASCTPCGGHRGTLGSVKAPRSPLQPFSRMAPQKESAVSFVALVTNQFQESSPEAFLSSYTSLTSDKKQTVKRLQSTKWEIKDGC